MGFDQIKELLAGEWSVISHAPITFLASIAIFAFAIWKWVQREFSIQLKNAESTITLLEKTLDRSEADQEGNQKTPPAPTRSSSGQKAAKASSTPSVETGTADLTIKRLTNLFAEHTRLQAAAMAAEHYGTIMSVSGSIRNVHQQRSDGSVMVSLDVGENSVFCFFDQITARLIGLRKKDPVTVRGTLKEVSSLGVDLSGCEIL